MTKGRTDNSKLTAPMYNPHTVSPVVCAKVSEYVYKRPPDLQQELSRSGWQKVSESFGHKQYYAVAMANPKERILVIGFRGTTVRSVLSSVKTVYGKDVTSAQTRKSLAFTKDVLKTTAQMRQSDGPPWRIVFTGHSLGGWLAAVAGFSHKQLKPEVITFENPGSHDAIHSELAATPQLLKTLKQYASDCKQMNFMGPDNPITQKGKRLGEDIRIEHNFKQGIFRGTASKHSMTNLLKATELLYKNNELPMRMLEKPLQAALGSVEFLRILEAQGIKIKRSSDVLQAENSDGQKLDANVLVKRIVEQWNKLDDVAKLRIGEIDEDAPPPPLPKRASIKKAKTGPKTANLEKAARTARRRAASANKRPRILKRSEQERARASTAPVKVEKS